MSECAMELVPAQSRDLGQSPFHVGGGMLVAEYRSTETARRSATVATALAIAHPAML